MKQLVKEENLVFIQKYDVFTNSKIIADNSGIRHDKIKRVIEKHIDRFKRFGKLSTPYEVESFTGGRHAEVYNLNEQQATFLITLLKNTEKVLNFKEELVRQFYKAKKRLEEIKTPEYQQLRLTAKSSTKTLHDIIKEKYIPYAIESGSKTYKEKPRLAYNNFEKVINKSLQIVSKGREYLSGREQMCLDMANNIISCLIEDCIDKQVEYHEIVERAKDKATQLVGVLPIYKELTN